MAGAYQTGIYRNVLKECGYDETAIGERLEQTFETIFYGTEAERFYHEAGDDMAYLEDTGNHLSHGGFAAAVWAGDDDKFSCLHRQADVPQNLLLRIIGKFVLYAERNIFQFEHIVTPYSI